jgi:hypothetical protein
VSIDDETSLLFGTTVAQGQGDGVARAAPPQISHAVVCSDTERRPIATAVSVRARWRLYPRGSGNKTTIGRSRAMPKLKTSNDTRVSRNIIGKTYLMKYHDINILNRRAEETGFSYNIISSSGGIKTRSKKISHAELLTDVP